MGRKGVINCKEEFNLLERVNYSVFLTTVKERQKGQSGFAALSHGKRLRKRGLHLLLLSGCLDYPLQKKGVIASGTWKKGVGRERYWRQASSGAR